MAHGDSKFIGYYRVSTAKQGLSGYGLDAQKQAVRDYVARQGGKLIKSFSEEESGKSAINRPKLKAAFSACRVYGAILVIGKLDRLSRDAEFLFSLKKASEHKHGVKVIMADFPEATDLHFGFMAMLADWERKQIGRRTKEALAQVKLKLANGDRCHPSVRYPDGRDRLGKPENLRNQHIGRERGWARGRASRTEHADRFAKDLMDEIVDIKSEGVTSLKGIARTLTAREIPTPLKKPIWSAAQVSRLLNRIEEINAVGGLG